MLNVLVSLQIHQQDRLSARICHACISYLNSWQSFKNRCTAAEKRQKYLLERYMANQRKQKASQQASALANAQRQRQLDQQRNQVMQQRLLKQALSQPNQQQPPHSSPLSAAQRIVNSFQLNSSVEVVSCLLYRHVDYLIYFYFVIFFFISHRVTLKKNRPKTLMRTVKTRMLTMQTQPNFWHAKMTIKAMEATNNL